MRALLIIGHGSTLNPDSSTPTHQHADAIRKMGVYDEVACAFWKEEPSMSEVFYQLRSEQIDIVPNFISEGYFCQQVLPRELQLDGAVTIRDGRHLFYTDPVGVHTNMTKLLVKRADEVLAGTSRERASLIIVGHGTTLNDNSRRAIEDQVQLIREEGYGFGEVLSAFMEEAPLVAKWDEMASCNHVVVVPFFIADGLHSYQDIPVLLGIEKEPTVAASQNEVFRNNPYLLRGKTLYYSSAIGTEASMAQVILDQVHDFQKPDNLGAPTWQAPASCLPDSDFCIGQVQVRRQQQQWMLHHREDHELAKLQSYDQPEQARTIGLYDEQQQFRPIKTAPNLRRGWKLFLNSDEDLRLALDFFYPAALGLWEHYLAGRLQPIALRKTLARQTGMYRYSNTITDAQALTIVERLHAPTQCLREITWPLSESQPWPDTIKVKQASAFANYAPDTIPLLSLETTPFVVGEAREQARQNFQEKREG